MIKLDPDEREILEAFERGKLKRIRNRQHELAGHRTVAAATVVKNSRIGIRISTSDLRALQKRALAEGISYQALASRVLHEFLEGQIRTVESRTGKRSQEKRSKQ